jgi:hypothetical protein
MTEHFEHSYLLAINEFGDDPKFLALGRFGFGI